MIMISKEIHKKILKLEKRIRKIENRRRFKKNINLAKEQIKENYIFPLLLLPVFTVMGYVKFFYGIKEYFVDKQCSGE